MRPARGQADLAGELIPDLHIARLLGRPREVVQREAGGPGEARDQERRTGPGPPRSSRPVSREPVRVWAWFRQVREEGSRASSTRWKPPDRLRWTVGTALSCDDQFPRGGHPSTLQSQKVDTSWYALDLPSEIQIVHSPAELGVA